MISLETSSIEKRIRTLEEEIARLEAQQTPDTRTSAVEDPYLQYARERLLRARALSARENSIDREVNITVGVDPWFKGQITCDRFADYGFLNGEPFFGGVDLVRNPRNHPCTQWEIGVSRICVSETPIKYVWIEDWKPDEFGFYPPMYGMSHRIKVINGVGGLRWLHHVQPNNEVRLAIDERMEGAQWNVRSLPDPVSGFQCWEIGLMGANAEFTDANLTFNTNWWLLPA